MSLDLGTESLYCISVAAPFVDLRTGLVEESVNAKNEVFCQKCIT